jgi:hypothetical protein
MGMTEEQADDNQKRQEGMGNAKTQRTSAEPDG